MERSLMARVQARCDAGTAPAYVELSGRLALIVR